MNPNLEAIPSWLETPPDTNEIDPPVETRQQELPFEKLTWENFERLCLRLARLEVNVEHCQLYGERGYKQEGIDIYARQQHSEKYRVYQCKRVKDFGPKEIESAVSKFLEGIWVDQTDTFVLCTQESLVAKQRADKVESQRTILQQKGITLILWDKGQLDEKLKAQYHLVQDFFGKVWANAFCGTEPANSLVTSQYKESVVENYTKWLKETTSDFIVLGIEKKLSIENDWIPLKAKQSNGDQEIFKAEFIPQIYHLSVVVGNPGSGKSTLIKRLAHQLSILKKKVLLVKLRPDKEFEELILSDNLANNSSLDKDELRFALSYPDYLLVDGLDECGDNRANIAKALRDWAVGHSKTRIIVTTRIGYELELFPSWENIEIQPLEKSDILNFSKKLLEDSLSNTETIEDQLTAFDKWLQNTKTTSLAARNPLLLGFLIQLFKIDVEIIQNRANLYKLIIAQFISRPVQDREPIKFGKPEAQRILTISGWELLNEPYISEEELLEKIIEELEFKGYTLPESETQAEAGISFWENRRIFERVREKHQDVIQFIHLTLCEYAAGKYVSDLGDQKICKWLEEVRQDIKWQEVILFAAGLGKVEVIVNHLLKLENLEDTTSTDVLLAAKALMEVNKAPLELIKSVVNRLQIRLESPNPPVVIESAKTLLQLISQAPDLIGNIAQSLSHHNQSWTRLAAIRLVLECGDNYVDLSILKEVIDECITEPAKRYYLLKLPYIVPPSDQQKKDYGKYGREFQEEVLVQGFQLLLNKQPNLETFKYLKSVISNEDFSLDTTNKLDEIFTTYVLEAWKNEKDTKYKKEYESLLMKLGRLDKPITLQQSLLQNLKKLKQKEITKYADKSFIEAILRVIYNNSKISISVQKVQELIALGVLFKGMGWWILPTNHWDILSECHDLDAVDAVIKGAIAAMNIEPQRIAIEAEIALRQIQFYDDLDTIESALKGKTIKSENSAQNFDWALKKLIYITNKKMISLFSKIPKVPADPEWERAREIDISPENLVRALKHPFQGIYQNATLLLMNGVGGSEAINLVEKLLKENKDNEQVVWAVSNIAPHLLEDEALEIEN